MQRNPYWPLKGPSFFSALRFQCFFFASRKATSASVQNSRRGWQADNQAFHKLFGAHLQILVFASRLPRRRGS